jgi:hypothetical protein
MNICFAITLVTTLYLPTVENAVRLTIKVSKDTFRAPPAQQLLLPHRVAPTLQRFESQTHCTPVTRARDMALTNL